MDGGFVLDLRYHIVVSLLWKYEHAKIVNAAYMERSVFTISLENAYDNDKKRGTRKMDYYRAFPFYMGYQGYGQWAQPGMVPEDRILEDLEYLQQMYPTYAKKYQSVISSVVDKVDYDDSFIYDQYPDKLTIQRMVSSVMTIIKTNEEKENGSGNMPNNPTPMQNMQIQNMPNAITPMQNMPNTAMPMQNMSDTATPMQNMPNTMTPMSGMPNTTPMQNVPMPEISDNTLTERAPWNEKEPWIRELVTVLMYYEILARRKRRQKKYWYT